MKLSIILLSVLLSTQIRAQRPIPTLIFEIHGSFGEIQGNDTNYIFEAVCEMDNINFKDSSSINKKRDGSVIDSKSDTCHSRIQFVEGKSRMFHDSQLLDGYWEFSWDIHPFIVKRKIKITELTTGRVMYLVVDDESKFIDYLRLIFEPGEYRLMTKLK
jgi:hypothetical protein